MKYLLERDFFVSLTTGIGLLIASIVINSYAVAYANATASNSVTDIVLSNTRVYDVDGFFVYGAVALVVVIRSFFLSLTHISPYPGHVAITSNIFTALFPSIFTGDDLFFSGHTGLPFLLMLIFWDVVPLRFFFLACSILFGIVVLLGHLHYSIDVASAFFITYSIFELAKVFFKRDWMRFQNPQENR